MSYLPIFLILLGSFVLRAFAAWTSVGYDHPNEIQRLFEPMAATMGYSAHLAWEWSDGLLSVLPIHAHLFLISLFKIFGVNEPFLQMQLLRLVYATLSIAPVWVAWKWVKNSGASSGMALLAAACLGFWPEWIYRSVRLMDYSLEASFSAIAVGLVFWTWKRERKNWNPPVPGVIGAGIVLGICFFVRFQSGLHLIGVAGGLIWAIGSKKSRSAVLLLLATYGVTVLVGGLIEQNFFATPKASRLLAPFFNYVQFNWIDGGAAREYGAQPWHRYLSEAAKFYGFAPALLFVLLMLHRRIQWPWAFMALFPILIHSLILHKEGRFIFGALWLWVPAALCSLRFFSVVERRTWGTFMALALGVGIYVDGIRIREHFLLRATEMKEFAEIGRLLDQVQAEYRSENLKAKLKSNETSSGAPERLPLLQLKMDPVFNPGAFFLRYRGPECLNDECKSLEDGQPYLSVFRDPSGVWLLERHDVEDI